MVRCADVPIILRPATPECLSSDEGVHAVQIADDHIADRRIDRIGAEFDEELALVPATLSQLLVEIVRNPGFSTAARDDFGFLQDKVLLFTKIYLKLG